MDFRPPASLDDLCREWTAEEFDFVNRNPLCWTTTVVPILARSSPDEILKVFEASTEFLSADEDTRPLVLLFTTTSTISFVLMQYLNIVRRGQLGMRGGRETQMNLIPAISVLASMIAPQLQEALPCVRDCAAGCQLTKSLLVLSRHLSQLVLDNLTFRPSNAAEVFPVAFDIFLTAHASLLEVIKRDPVSFRKNFLEQKQWQIFKLKEQYDQYFIFSNEVVDSLVAASNMALFFLMTQYLFVLSSLDALHVVQALVETFVSNTSFFSYLSRVDDLDILPDSISEDDARLLVLRSSIPQGLSALLNAVALMALDPTGTPAPAQLKTLTDRRNFAFATYTSVRCWLRLVMDKGEGGEYFAHNTLDGPEVRLNLVCFFLHLIILQVQNIHFLI